MRNLAKKVGELMADREMALALAESCTGGLISHQVTNVSGSSSYFLGGVVSYANSAKMNILGVPEETLNMIDRTIGKQCVIARDFGRDLWRINANATGIDLIVMNLVANSKDAMPEGGTITIRTENIHVKEDTISQNRCNKNPLFNIIYINHDNLHLL